MSIRGFNINPQINRLALDGTLQTTNRKLDNLINVTGTDSEVLEEIKTEIQATNTELETMNTTLNTANDKYDQSNEKLDNIIEEAELLKRQEVENITDYDFDLFNDTLVPQAPIPPANPYIKDPFGRNAWYLNNIEAGSTQLYWYATDNPFGFKSNSVLTLGQIVEGGGFYFAMYIDKVDASLSLPIFGVYTTPTGSGDAVPGFYKSRKTYGIATNQKLFSGELIVCYNSITILDKIKNVLPTCRRVLLSQSTSVGPAGNDETIRYMSINNDSLTPPGDVQWSVVGAGWYDGSSSPVIRHFRFSVNRQQQEQSVQDILTHTLLSNTNAILENMNEKIFIVNTSDISGSVSILNQITDYATNTTLEDLKDEVVNTNDKLENIHDDIKDTEDLIRDVKEVLQDIENNTGDTNDKLTQLNIFNKSLLVQQVQNNTIHYMMCSRTGGGDTSGSLIVSTERTGHILPLLTAEKFKLQSSNDLNKAFPAQGLRQVKITGLDGSGNIQSEFMETNGVTEVNTNFDYIHIYDMQAVLGNMTSGSVFIKRSSDNVKYVQISDQGLTYSNGFFMVPKNYKAVISSIIGNDFVSSNLYILKYTASTQTRNAIFRFYNRNNSNLIFENGLGIQLNELESFYLWNTEATNDVTHYNIKVELIPPSQL